LSSEGIQMRSGVWKRLNDGRWTAQLGSRGQSIRLHQLSTGGSFYRDIGGGSRKSRKSLGTRDRGQALEIGKRILAELLRAPEVRDDKEQSVLTLKSLWDNYRSSCAAWLDNKPSSRRDDEWRAKLLLNFFGEDYEVMALCENEQRRYEAARIAGLLLSTGAQLRSVRQGTVWADIVLLQAMLRWGATKYKCPSGKPMLPYNPLAGVPNHKESAPVRPVVTEERYQQLIAATKSLACDPSQKAAEKWRLFELFLRVLNGTGRRSMSVRHLRWSDINHERKEVCWRAKYDKKAREQTLPISDDLAQYIADAYEERGRPRDGWIFPAIKDDGVPLGKRVLADWLAKAEQRASLPKIVGGALHPFRRKFASELKDKPVKLVMELGGWRDQKTLQTCYVQATEGELRALVNRARSIMLHEP